MNKSKILQFVNIGVTSLVLLFCIITISTRYWFTRDAYTRVGTVFGIAKINAGLWKICSEFKEEKRCASIDDFTFKKSSEEDKFKVTRAFSILAILAFGTALLCVCLTFVKKPFNIPFVIITILGALFQMIAMSVFTQFYKDETENDISKLGWSADLGWAAFVFSLISCGCSIALVVVQKK